MLLKAAHMPAGATHLCDRQLKATGKDFVLSDGNGLQVRVRASGSMMWNFNYREPLIRSRINMALGPYLDLSRANARKKAAEARELLALGTDPKTWRDEIRQARLAETEHTFEKVATAWFVLKKDAITNWRIPDREQNLRLCRRRGRLCSPVDTNQRGKAAIDLSVAPWRTSEAVSTQTATCSPGTPQTPTPPTHAHYPTVYSRQTARPGRPARH